MNIHLSEQLRYLESHQKEFEKLITEALSSDLPSVQQPVLSQAYQVLKEVEQILERKFQNRGKDLRLSSPSPKTIHEGNTSDINFVFENLLIKLNKISQQSDNLIVQSYLLKIYDLILRNRLITFENKETGNLVYFINDIFLLHDIFQGTTLAKRIVQRTKYILNYILKRKDINEDQQEEISELLQLQYLKGSDIFNNFEQETADIKQLCKSQIISDKLSGLTQLMEKLAKCQSLNEQLTLFSTKCQPLIKLVIRDVKENDEQIFDQLSQFLHQMIFDTEYLVQVEKDIIEEQAVPESVMDHDKNQEVKLYQLTEQKDILENSEGLYTSVALIINFFLSFPKRIALQYNVLLIFKRLYTSFPVFRKNLEDPIIMVLINIHHKYNELQLSLQVHMTCLTFIQGHRRNLDAEEQRIEDTYVEAQHFVNYLLSNDDTESSFKEKLFSRKELSFYLQAKNLETYKPNTKCLHISKYGDFNLKIGFPSTQDIEAGAQFFQMVEVEEPNSIIFCGFQTTSYDIQFAFQKVTQQSTVASEDAIEHKDLEDIFPVTKIESHPNFVKVSFIAKEAGIYKILWSNDHSWFKGKTLLYRISVLKPINEINQNESSEQNQQNKSSGVQQNQQIGGIINIQKLTTQKKQSLQKLLDIPQTVISSYSNIDQIKRRELQNTGWEEQIYFIQIDLDYEQIKISQNDLESEITNELGQTDDLTFILDENLHHYMKSRGLNQPSNKTYTKMFILLSKSDRSQPLLRTFDNKQIKYLANCFYDIYLMHDCDAATIYMALNVKDEVGKSKKKTLQENAFIFVKLNQLGFESSICLKQKIVQDDNQYSYDIGNIGSIELMSETYNINTSDGSEDSESSEDEAAGSHADKRKVSSPTIQRGFVMKELREVWKDAKALGVAINNFHKISGVKVNVMMSVSEFEDQAEKENIKKYFELLKQEMMVEREEGIVNLELREEEIVMYAIKNIYKFVEVHQQQYYD